MNVPLLDLKAQYATVRSDIEAAISQVLESQQFILGPSVEACESAIAAYSQCAYGIGMSSGTDALLACLMTEGIGPGDEVITTTYSFFATAGAVVRVGATPVFVDIDPGTYNLDASEIEGRITSRSRAIIPVHLYGQLCNMDRVMQVARKHALVVIEDAAQAIGAEHRGRRAGSIGDYGCFSFFPSKNLGGAGDGGMVVTNDAQRADRVRCVRGHGASPKYHHKMIGGNFRLDALQAAIVSAKLPHLDRWTAARQRNAELYRRLLIEAGLTDESIPGPSIVPPSVVTDRHVFNQYVIRCTRRDELQRYLAQCGVGSEVYYPVPMHRQQCFAYLPDAERRFPESERAAGETLALPVNPEVAASQIEHVVSCVERFVRTQGESARAAVAFDAGRARRGSDVAISRSALS
jgi:dTDP-4-amino-4,6-dideoxygalactose transaminase